MGITVKDVAYRAGVSAATVSRVINLDARISPETTHRVRLAIDELGYTVNHLARSLKTNRSFSVGLIVPEFRNDFFMGVAQGIEQTLNANQLSLMICNSNENEVDEAERISLLLDKRVDGILLIPATDSGKRWGPVTTAKVPIVLVDRRVSDFEADSVLADNSGGTQRAVSEALRQGHKRIGFLGGDQRLTSAKERFEGYRQALSEAGITADPTLERFGDFHSDSGYELMGELMGLGDPPKVVFISNYFMHVGATRYLSSNQGSNQSTLATVPWIISFDDLELSFALGFSRILVRQPTLDLGRRAAELLMDRMTRGFSGPARAVRLPTEVVLR